MVLQFKPTEGLVCKGKDAKPDKAQCFKYQVPGGMVTPIVYRFFKNAWYWSPEPDGSDNFQTCDTTKIADMGLWKVMQFVGVTDVHDENKFVIDLLNDLVPKAIYILFFLFCFVYGHTHTSSPRSNWEDLGLSTRRAMTRHIRMGVLLNRQA